MQWGLVLSIPLLGLVPPALGQHAVETSRPSLMMQGCSRPHVIAHRGASGYLPEHTLQAYRLAIDLGVDYIEPDLVITKDGHLVVRHDVDLTETTDVATRPEFRDRLRNVTLMSAVEVDFDGSAKEVVIEGYFSFDFTLAEIKSLRAKQRLTQRSTTYNGFFQVPTFEEVIDMVRESEKDTGRPIGIYAELKEPYFFKLNGHDVESKLVEVLTQKNMLRPVTPNPHFKGKEQGDQDSDDVPVAPLVVQCFDQETLMSLSTRIPQIPLVQLLVAPEAEAEDDSISYILQREGVYGRIPLKAIATYASGIGPHKNTYTDVSPEAGRAMVEEAHRLGLAVHPWTFRREALFVGRNFSGDSDRELRFFYECLNVDALFVEQPDQAGAIIDQMLRDDEVTIHSVVSVEMTQPPTTTAIHRDLQKTACLSKRRTRSCGAMDAMAATATNIPRWLTPKRSSPP